MPSIGFKIGVFMLLGIKIGAKVVVVLNEEVGLAYANPEEAGFLAKQIVDLGVAVGIDLGMTAIAVLLLIYGCGEQTDIIEEVRIVDADEEAVETTH